MVSQPDTSNSLTIRGSSSVVSRPSSSSRTKRYNRSHVGGTSFIPQNEFPVFTQSGDVEILVRVADHQNRYLLHRHTLTRCSGFFEASTSQEWSRAQSLPEPSSSSSSSATRPGRGRDDQLTATRAPSSPARKRWRFELDPGVGDGDFPMLVQKQDVAASTPSLFGSVDAELPVSSGRSSSSKPSRHAHSSSAHSSRSFFRSVANLSLVPAPPAGPGPPLSQADIDLLRDYDNLFRIFYNYHPQLDGVNIADAYVQCKSLLNLADQYDALAVVGPRVDHHLLQFQSRLWKQIAKYPISYLRLGYLARSRVIFQEALIHVVGQWPAGERSLRTALPDGVLDIIEDKVDELEEMLDGVNIADAYVQCKSLLSLADQYDALAVVGPRVDHHLLQFQSRLWKQIAKYPISYLRLGYLARSRVIFQEALIHVVGQWPAGERSLRAALPDGVLDIIEDKVDELEEMVTRVESRLFRLSLFTARGDRVTPSTAYLDWLALSLFRQWLAENTGSSAPDHHTSASRNGRHNELQVGPLHPQAPPMAAAGRALRMLGSPAASLYLSHDDCKRFLKLTPELYSRDNLRRFEKRVDEVKSMAREIVRPLMSSRLELELGGGRSTDAITYLTCVTVSDRDLPWRYES
ncbi:hypothetical protein BN1723_004600 [Verticillium longisporum]|uniref:BTB domain-containing protein n=1 Tax=Verticillium longisporum TaxID=100787 RepID=A0A0G4MZY3_VERLO|nr:hypothetical protein BN1723_004600 [Verticillium longisporum]